jgi:hypothetical protein
MGITTLALKHGPAKTKIALKGKGAALGGLNLLPATLPLIAQLRAGNGQCWSATFDPRRR